MSAAQQLDDVRYVRSLLERPAPSPASIPLLWAGIVAVGFALVDLAPERVGLFWAFAAPIGTVLSIFLGHRAAVARGEMRATDGIRWMAHWVGVMVLIGGAVGLAQWGVLPHQGLNTVIILLITAAYFLAGVHLEHRLLWVAAAFALTLPLAELLPRYGWVVAGGVVAASLVATALVGRARA